MRVKRSIQNHHMNYQQQLQRHHQRQLQQQYEQQQRERREREMRDRQRNSHSINHYRTNTNNQQQRDSRQYHAMMQQPPQQQYNNNMYHYQHDYQNSMQHVQQKNSEENKEFTIEVLVAVDRKMQEYHGKNLKNYVLTLMSVVSNFHLMFMCAILSFNFYNSPHICMSCAYRVELLHVCEHQLLKISTRTYF